MLASKLNNGVVLLFPFPTTATMRLIGVTEGQQKVGNFAAWLLTQEIETKIETTEDGKMEVWVKEEDHFKTALAQYEEFLANPEDPKYSSAVSEANQILRKQEKKRREIQKKQMNVPRSSGGMGTPTGPMTKTVMILCLLVAILTNFNQDKTLQEQGANRWFLQFGRMIEGRYGTVWMAILVVAIAILSNFAQGVAPERLGGSAPYFPSGILISSFGGLSGVVFGLFGFIVIKQYSDPRSGFFLPQLTIVILLGYMVFCMLPVATPLVGSIANWCHVIGFLSGVVMAYLKY